MKKIIAIFVSIVLCVSLAVSVSAFEGSADIALYAGNSANWTTASSDPVTVNADGEYTLKLEGLSITPDTATVIYIKDSAVEAGEKESPTFLPTSLYSPKALKSTARK